MAMLSCCYYSQYHALSNCPRNMAFPQSTWGDTAFAGNVCNWEPSPCLQEQEPSPLTLLLLAIWCDTVFVARRPRTGLKSGLICAPFLPMMRSHILSKCHIPSNLYAQFLPLLKVLLYVPKYLAGVLKLTLCCLIQTRLSHSDESFPNSF